MEGMTVMARGEVVVRPARESDLDRVVEVHLATFPDARAIEVHRRIFLHNRLGGLAHLRVAAVDDEIVAHAFAFPVALWIGGKPVVGKAIASVGVALEARTRGVASALLGSVHEEARQAGDAFTILFPFGQGFYARLGYARVAPFRILTVSPLAIPEAWQAAAPGIVRAPRSGDLAEIVRVYRSAARRATGYLDRPHAAWQTDLVDHRRRWLVLEQGGRLAGYMCLQLSQPETEPRAQLFVDEVVAENDAARARLFGVIRTLRDQVGEVRVAVADDDPLGWALTDADRARTGVAAVEHHLGVVRSGPMIRLTDHAAALTRRGYYRDGEVAIAVDDAPPFTITVEGGTARLAAAGAAPVVRMTSEALTAVAFGGLRLEDADRLGWVSCPDERSLLLAAEVLRVPPFFTLDVF
jgi:predicted acetyltransferase